MRRREFSRLLGCALIGRALPVQAQQRRSRVIGILGPSFENALAGPGYAAFVEELRRQGLEENNLKIEYRFTDNGSPGPVAGAADLVRLNVDLIVTVGSEAALKAAAEATRTIPIVVMATNFDPLERGYIGSLARPGGNITGFINRFPELTEKQLELITEAFPDRLRLAILWDTISADQANVALSAAEARHLQVRSIKLENPPYDFEAAFKQVARDGGQMVLVLSSPFFTLHRAALAELALRHRLPTMFIFKHYVDSGGLMSYGPDGLYAFRRVAEHAAKILRGAKPADVPVEQAAQFQLILNLKTARALGLTIPPTLLARADEVIE